MSNSLEVIKFRDIIRLTELPKYVSGQDELTMEVRGEDFSSVEKVYLNEKEVFDYTIFNRNLMWLKVPSDVSELRSLEVISGNFTKTNIASKVTYQIGTSPKKISGILALVQLYTKWLLQGPGSDIWNPSRGGGMQDIIGSLVNIDRMDRVLSAITQAVEFTSSQIRTAQTSAKGLALSERLLSATLVDINRVEERLEVHTRIHIISMAGDEAVNALIL